jgi:hypothetical protein
MIFNGYATVVSDDKDISLFHPAGRQIPIAPITHIGLFDLFAVHIKLPIPEFDFLPFQGHNPLQEHDPGPRKPDGYHIIPVRIGKEVSTSPAEMKISIPIRRFHAGSLNPERKTNKAEKKVRGKGHQPHPDEKSGRKFGKEETADGPAGGDHLGRAPPGILFGFIWQNRDRPQFLCRDLTVPLTFSPSPGNKRQNP